MVLGLTLSSCGRNCWALQPCVTCSPVSFPLPRAEGELAGRAESSELPVPFAVTSIQHGSLSRGVLATEFFHLLGERMAGPSRGHAWPGECARVPQFKMTLPICPIGSSILEVHLEVFHPWTSTASYLLLPHSHCCRCLLQTGTFMTKSFSSQKGCYG